MQWGYVVNFQLVHGVNSQAGAYFVTICTYDKERVFNEIINGEMRLNDIGKIVELG